MQEPIEIYSELQPFIKKEIDDAIAKYASDRKFDVAQIPAHTHTGIEASPVSFNDLTERSRYILYRIVEATTSVTVASSVGGDFIMPFSGYITSTGATVDVAGTTGTMTIDIKKSGSSVFTNKITIDSGSKTSRSASTKSLLTSSKINFNIGDVFTFDVTTIQTTPAKGLSIFMNVIETTP